jgi:hypothetical protein
MLGDRTSQLELSCGTGVTAWHFDEQDHAGDDEVNVESDS